MFVEPGQDIRLVAIVSGKLGLKVVSHHLLITMHLRSCCPFQPCEHGRRKAAWQIVQFWSDDRWIGTAGLRRTRDLHHQS